MVKPENGMSNVSAPPSETEMLQLHFKFTVPGETQSLESEVLSESGPTQVEV